MFKKMCVLTVGMSLLLGACASRDSVEEKNVKGRDLHRSYKVAYGEEKQELTFLAQVRVDDQHGDTVRFPKPAGFSANKLPLTLLDGKALASSEPLFKTTFNGPNTMAAYDRFRRGSFYERTEKTAVLPLNHVVEWFYEDGKKREEIKVAMPQKLETKSEQKSWRRGEKFLVSWEGALNEANEGVEGALEVITANSSSHGVLYGDEAPKKPGETIDLGAWIEKTAGTEEIKSVEFRFVRVRMGEPRKRLISVSSEYVSKLVKVAVPKK